MQATKVSAVLFVKDLRKVATFYREALEMQSSVSDEHHEILHCHGFDLVVHQIPHHIAVDISIEDPPERRVWGAIRLDYPVRNLAAARKRARSLGGGIDDVPPEWADRDANFFLAYDPEGNQLGVSERV